MSLSIQYQLLTTSDYPKLVELWNSAECIDIRPHETADALKIFLQKNPTSNYGAYFGEDLIGAVLAGHDGWRGYLYHMAVKADYRKRGIGAKLTAFSVNALKKEGISRVHCLVKQDNAVAQTFWQACGFSYRNELSDYSLDLTEPKD